MPFTLKLEVERFIYSKLSEADIEFLACKDDSRQEPATETANEVVISAWLVAKIRLDYPVRRGNIENVGGH